MIPHSVSKSPVHLPGMLHEKIHAVVTQCGRGGPRPGAQVNYAQELAKPHVMKSIKGTLARQPLILCAENADPRAHEVFKWKILRN